MNRVIDAAAHPRLDVEDCWPASGSDGTNTSHEHQVQADGADWNRITPNGSTFDTPPRSRNQYTKAAMERRTVLCRGGATAGISDVQTAINNLETAAETLHEHDDDLAFAVSGVLGQAKEKRQEFLTKEVGKLNQALSQETATIGVLMVGGYHQWLMGQLGGFFVKSADALDAERAEHSLWRPEPGILIAGSSGEIGQVPEGYKANGLYLKAA